MNRGEQESLFRQSHTFRLQQDAKAHNDRIRHYSHGNIHQVSNLHSQAANSRSFGEDRPFGASPCDDLVLSVLKTPLKESSLCTPTPSPQSCVYSALPGSEDELVDDVESAKEIFELESEHHRSPASSFQFLRRFRPGRAPRFEPHHRRVPTPMRRKSRHRSKSHADILTSTSCNRGTYGVDISLFMFFLHTSECCCVCATMQFHNNVVLNNQSSSPGISASEVTGEDDNDGDEQAETVVSATGVPDPYYPIALPIDQAFKAKYVFHHRRGKTFQERLYVFLEHPGGWLCFIYHFTV